MLSALFSRTAASSADFSHLQRASIEFRDVAKSYGDHRVLDGVNLQIEPGEVVAILLPQALRNVQPSLVGIFIGLLKDTSLAFIVNVPELTTVAGQVNNRVQIYPLAIFVFTGAVYYLLCCGLSLLASRRFTRRATAG